MSTKTREFIRWINKVAKNENEATSTNVDFHILLKPQEHKPLIFLESDRHDKFRTKFVETINVHAIRSIFMYSRISGSIILYYMHCNKLNYTLLQGPRYRLDDE